MTSDELENDLQLTKNGKISGEITLIRVVQVRTRKVKSNITTIFKSYIKKRCIPNEWENYIIIQIFTEVDRRNPKI
jgi:hypothetical protein